MKIIHLLSSDRFSGAENVVCQIMEMTRERPDTEMLYCSPDGEIRDVLAERGLPFVPLRRMTVPACRRVFREQKPDLIHAHDMKAGCIAALACGKIPLVSHIHNNHFQSRRLSVKSVAYLPAARKAGHIFWVSESARDGYVFRRLCARKSEVLPNILSAQRLYEKMRQDPGQYAYDLVYLGRLSYPKDPQRLMRVIAGAAAVYPGLKAAVIGTGELEAEVRKLAVSLGIEDRVDFLGYRSNPLKILHDAKVMVMTSRWEGMPMCALEAMTLGVPIVSTPTDGLRELVEDGINGYLSSDDAVLVQKITAVITEEALRQRLSDNGKEKAARLNAVEPYRDRILQVYAAVLEDTGHRECR